MKRPINYFVAMELTVLAMAFAYLYSIGVESEAYVWAYLYSLPLSAFFTFMKFVFPDN